MKILITGANGQVGWELARQARDKRYEVHALGHNGLDISNSETVGKVVKEISPEIIINTAAYTAVDKAEEEPELAFAVNRDGPAILARVCKNLDIPLIHISTDYVFDGTKKGEYTESDVVAPLGVYGQSKLEGEEGIKMEMDKYLILRTSWVFGIHGKNFVKTICRLTKERESLNVVDDQIGCPTPASDIAEVILDMSKKVNSSKTRDWGTYHYCGTPATTWYSFAKSIVEQLDMNEGTKAKKIEPIKTRDYPTPAKRPENTILNCSKIYESFGIRQRAWQSRLAEVIEDLMKTKEAASS